MLPEQLPVDLILDLAEYLMRFVYLRSSEQLICCKLVSIPGVVNQIHQDETEQDGIVVPSCKEFLVHVARTLTEIAAYAVHHSLVSHCSARCLRSSSTVDGLTNPCMNPWPVASG